MFKDGIMRTCHRRAHSWLKAKWITELRSSSKGNRATEVNPAVPMPLRNFMNLFWSSSACDSAQATLSTEAFRNGRNRNPPGSGSCGMSEHHLSA
jgi:hypothetical protein